MVIDCYAPYWGGAESQMTQLASRLSESGCEITVLTRRWDKNLLRRDSAFGFPVFRVGFPGRSIGATASYVLELFLFALTKRKTFDIIHTHGAAALGAVGRVMAVLSGKKNVAKVSSSLRIPQLQKKPWGGIVLKIFSRSAAITGLSEQIRQQLLEIGTPPDRIKKLYNGVDTELFRPLNREEKDKLREQFKFSPTDLIFLYTGRLVASKGLEDILAVWTDIRDMRPDAKLILVGSGKCGGEGYRKDSVEEELKKTVSDKKLPDIFFAGEQEHPEVYYQIADIFIFLSRSEGVSNVLLEAMASGLCIIASDIGGNRELITHNQNGVLVPVGDSQKLCQAITRCVSDAAIRATLGQAAALQVKTQYDFSIISKNYINVYQAALGGKG
ncbi:MAG TPA: glycosyltransferase family 4 protein [Candidatus Omnitrophota bacterium]|nr:glycosyltransferase family 4 protein [Candidatus Omnitrophota bacterium]HQO58857.1 glycosyltransferase family 4 protein [Candidatus Omnitrophota bacterium]